MMATKTKTKDRKHVYNQQLSFTKRRSCTPKRWCSSRCERRGWWCLIVAVNLLSCCSWSLAIQPTMAEMEMHVVDGGEGEPLGSTHQGSNTKSFIMKSTGNTTGVVAATKGHIAVAQSIVGDLEIPGTTRDVRGGSNESINNNFGRLHKQHNKEAKVSLKFSTSAIEEDVAATEPQRNGIATMEMNEMKGYTNTTATTTMDTATTISSGTTTTLPWDLNHTLGLTENAFHQECMENRNSLAHVFTVALYSVVCVVGLFGNTLVIWVVFRFSKMQTVTNIYILNLAIADECFLIGIPFLLYTMRICSWKFGEYMCKAYMVSTSITQFTSSIFLLIMAADRYLAVCHPIESPRYRTLRIAKLVSMIAWITSAILMMPVILFASTIRQEDGINYSCNIDWPEVYKKHSGTTFILYTFLLGFATPLCFILVFYYLVIKKLRSVQQKHKSKEKKRSHRKVTRLVLTVITVYIFCWLPHWVSQVSLINSFVGQRELTRVEILLFLLFGCLAYSNSAMNPILYAFLSDNFRKSFTKAFSCMTSHEVEAQLINENSVVTHKRTGSGAKQRKGSRRVSVPKTGPSPQQNNCFLAPTIVHNSGGGSSSGTSGTSASTATTATDKSSSNSQQQPRKEINGGVICTTTKDGEKITLVVNQDGEGEERVGVAEDQTNV
ncbi:somatostatin receptor type 3 [Musca domestica]|uniref:Somatostatin receptor type 3 n=2 Tax=Musca domestica TaxID=7370 RepID=A0A9J7CMV7_MUSDO|nr:somatostatin receptor type 3 [Musca domestica]